MPQRKQTNPCPDCETSLNRRDFVSALGVSAMGISALSGAAVVGSGLGMLSLGRTAQAAPSPKSDAETNVKRFYDSLSDDDWAIVCGDWNDSRRQKVSANWHITKANVSDFNKDQQKLIKEIVKGVTSEDGFERFLKQMEDDAGGIEEYSVAVFGTPGEKQFSFALTGRHLTLRADGNTTKNTAFGGPVVYGHSAKGNSEKNLFSYQTKRANEVYKALDGAQKKLALLSNAPKENAVQLQKADAVRPGIGGDQLSDDQKKLVKAVLTDIMAPYRKEDVDEVFELVEAGGGLDKMSMAFYSEKDLDGDGSWDIWRLESPTLVCHFRGAPHVHAYINVAKKG